MATKTGVKMEARRSFLYQGKMMTAGTAFEAHPSDVSWMTAGGRPLARKADAEAEPAAQEEPRERLAPQIDIENATKAELEAEVERLGVGDRVTGTGSGGNVLVADLRKVLRDCC
jgi:hypothetical protein